MKIRYNLLFFFFSLFIFSCGVKGPPSIPPSSIPEAVKDIHLKQQGHRIVVYWFYTPVYEDKKRIREIFHFKIEENDKELNIPIKSIKNLYWIERKINDFSKEYCYRIFITTERGNTAVSKYYCILPNKNFPKEKPEFSIKLDNNGFLLIFNKNYEQIVIYRGKSKKNIPPIGKTVVSGRYYLDTDVKIGNGYCYYATLKENKIEGDPSNTVCSINRDIFPPEPPKRFEYFIYRGKLFLIWTESSSKDVTGYLIERDGKVLTKDIINTYYYIINSWKKGDIFKIYSVDRGGNRSPPVYLRVE